MKKHLFISAMIIMCIFIVSACKKKDKNNTTTSVDVNSLILGKWQLTQIAYDNNGNKLFDSSEITNYTSGTKTVTFNSNGKMFDTGQYGTAVLTRSYQWSAVVNGPYIQLQTKSLDTGKYYGTTYTYTLTHIDAQGMKVQDSAAAPIAMYFYSKK